MSQLPQLTAQRLPRVSLHKGWQQVLREPNAVLDLQGLTGLEDEVLPDLDEDVMDDDQRQDPNDPPQTPAQPPPQLKAEVEAKPEVSEEPEHSAMSLEEAMEHEMEKTYPDVFESPGECEVIETIVAGVAAGPGTAADPAPVGVTTDQAEAASADKKKSAEVAAEESKQAGVGVGVSVETLPMTAPVAAAETDKTGNGGGDSGKAGLTPAPTEKSAEVEPSETPAAESEESKQAGVGVSVETLPMTAPVEETEKTGNGSNDSGKAGLTPAPTEKSAEVEPSEVPAAEESKQAGVGVSVETLPMTAPVEETEKTSQWSYFIKIAWCILSITIQINRRQSLQIKSPPFQLPRGLSSGLLCNFLRHQWAFPGRSGKSCLGCQENALRCGCPTPS